MNKNQPQIFFKTVRENYRSLYAHGMLARTYKVGSRYKFPKNLPAHVFTTESRTFSGFLDSDAVYKNRAEAGGGNRVMICYGVVEEKRVPCFSIGNETWNFGDYIPMETRLTSSNFVVIGEIKLPASYNGVRPPENKLTYGKGVTGIAGLSKFVKKA
jgi:hypothetical protein